MKITIHDILRVLPTETVFYGNANDYITNAVTPDYSGENKNVLFWLSPDNNDKVAQFLFGTIICSNKISNQYLSNNCNYILVENPRGTFRLVLEHFFADKPNYTISNTAIIHSSVVLGKNISIGNYCIIEENCSIGDNTVIGQHTVIKKNSKIGNQVAIGNHCVIGDKGFGYDQNQDEEWNHIPHIGGVIIEDDVSIHDFVSVNKGVLNNTLVGKGTKIDMYTGIAHGVQIGENNIICGRVGIAGSTTIGNNCWIAPGAMIINKITIGDNVFVGAFSNVIKSVPSNERIFGNPARSIKNL